MFTNQKFKSFEQSDKGQVPVTDAIDKDYQFIVNDSVGGRTQDPNNNDNESYY